VIGVGATGFEPAAQSSPKTEKQAGSSTSTRPSESKPSPDLLDSVATVAPVARSAEPTDAEIERRMVTAELAGRTTVADALARELEARRLSRTGNVVDIASARRGVQS
jgi:hypothetical protein